MKMRKNNRRRMGATAVGIDLGEERSETTYLSAEGDVIDQFSFSMNPEGYAEFARRIPVGTKIAFEASGMAYAVSKALQGMGYPDLTVAHPKELAWIVKSKKKNDRVDSVKLAKLHSVGIIPEAHLLDREDQIFRDLLIQMTKLGQETSRLKNSIIGYLKREGLFQNLPETSDNFSEERKDAMKAISFGDERDLVLSTMFARLESVERLTTPLEKNIRALARENPDVRLLMSIPGVNFYIGSLLSSYIGDVRRFPNADHLASFFGIVPTQRDSSTIKRVGRMSKDGPHNARRALSIMVDTVSMFDLHLHEYYSREKARTKSGKMAHVLTMRKLVRMIYAMLTKKEKWRWEKKALTERKLRRLNTD